MFSLNLLSTSYSDVPVIERTGKSFRALELIFLFSINRNADRDCRKKLILLSLSLSEKLMKSENKFVRNQYIKVLLFLLRVCMLFGWVNRHCQIYR